MNLKELLNRPLEIGGKTIESRLLLAPMAGITHVAFRRLVNEYGGAGLLYSEMSASRAIPTENPKVSKVFCWTEDEKPKLLWQIYGSGPEEMAAAAARCEREGFFGVDLNFGCSVGTIVRKGGGAALLRDPEKAAAVVAAVRRAVKIPLFVKFRTGWEDEPENAAGLARIFEENGADALTFHPRTAPDIRTRPPRWEYIGRVKDAVKIPVFGNGNVFGPEDCAKMMAETGCDGVALGRIAAVRPWVFADWCGLPPPRTGLHLAALKRFAGLCSEHFKPRPAVNRFKVLTGYMAADFAFGHSLAVAVKTARDMDDAVWAAESFFSDDPPPSAAPNPNMLR